MLSAGDKIPADCRIAEAEELYVDESVLTGESAPVGKCVAAIGAAPLAERCNMAYSGCFVTDGRGKAIVTAVGDGTELGKIAGSLETGEAETPIQLKLKKLGKRIALFGISASLITFAVSLIKMIASGGFSFHGVSDLFVTAIVLIVACVPEGLPTIVAVSLALNVIKMARANALVKKMAACETVGCISVICSDKTGTLTENRMTVVGIYGADGADVSRDGHVLKNICVNSMAELDDEGGFLGNPTECSLLKAAAAQGYDYRAARKNSVKTLTYPFSSELKRMTTVADGLVYVKGAPEIITRLCDMGGRGRAVLARIEKLQEKAERMPEKKTVVKKVEKKPEPENKKTAKLSYKQQRLLEVLPQEIAKAEEEISLCENELFDPDLYAKNPARFAELSARLAALQNEIETKENEWLEIQILKEELENA